MKWTILLVLALATSCTTSKWYTGTTFVEMEQEEYLVNSRGQFRVLFYGDYEFKQYRKSTVPPLDGRVEKHMRQSGASRKLYECYTFMDPYGRSAARLYNGETVESLLEERKEWLIAHPAFNVTSSELLEGVPSIQVVQYHRKPTVKTDPPVVYCEYLVPVAEGVVSLLFWSTESPYWLQRESRGIVNTLVLQPE
jgi:hypothetical protein